MAAKYQPTFEDFEPLVESLEEDGCSILTIYVPGFSKEQIRVQVSSTRKLRISGERPYKNNKTGQRFHKEFQIPSNCDTAKITARFKGGILHVRQPLLDEYSTKPPHTAAAQPPEPQSTAEDNSEKKSSSLLAANEKVEAAKSTNETKGSAFSNANEINSNRAGRLKEVILRPGVLVKFILPILVALLLLFLFAKRLSDDPNMCCWSWKSPQ